MLEYLRNKLMGMAEQENNQLDPWRTLGSTQDFYGDSLFWYKLKMIVEFNSESATT